MIAYYRCQFKGKTLANNISAAHNEEPVGVQNGMKMLMISKMCTIFGQYS